MLSQPEFWELVFTGASQGAGNSISGRTVLCVLAVDTQYAFWLISAVSNSNTGYRH